MSSELNLEALLANLMAAHITYQSAYRHASSCYRKFEQTSGKHLTSEILKLKNEFDLADDERKRAESTLVERERDVKKLEEYYPIMCKQLGLS